MVKLGNIIKLRSEPFHSIGHFVTVDELLLVIQAIGPNVKTVKKYGSIK
jgi:hypothetical protein